MAINLKNLEVERALQELSAATGESLTEAAGIAFRERLARVRAARARAQQSLVKDLMALIEEGRGAPVLDPRPLKEITDELWGDD
jgi:hypothetical protein